MPPSPSRTRCSQLPRDPRVASLEKGSKGVRMPKFVPTTPAQTVNTTPPTAVRNSHFDTLQAISTPASTSTTSTPNPSLLQLKITTDYFTPDDLESHLSTLLASYRALHPDPDLPPPPTKPNPDATKAVRRALEALFGGMPLRRPGNDGEGDFFLDQEEEDILDLFMTRVRDLAIPTTPRVERYPDLGTWLTRAGRLVEGGEGAWRFVKRVT